MDQPDEARLLGRWVREAYVAGSRPSAILRRLARHNQGTIFLIIAFREAFDLTLAECKAATGYSRGDVESLDDEGLDGFLTPIIEERRPSWHDRRATTVRLPLGPARVGGDPAMATTLGETIFEAFRTQLLAQSAGSSRYQALYHPPRTATTARAVILRFSATRSGGLLAHRLTMLLCSNEARRELDELLGRAGRSIDPSERSVARLLRGPEQPLVELGGQPFVVTRGGALLPIDHEGAIPPLVGADAENVARVGYVGQCLCRGCELVRRQHAATLIRISPDSPAPIAVLAEATRLVAQSPIGQRQARAAATALRGWDDPAWRAQPHGPPELQVLRDWLEERGAALATADATGFAFTQLRPPPLGA